MAADDDGLLLVCVDGTDAFDSGDLPGAHPHRDQRN